MPLTRVKQGHRQGCFYAGVASLLGISYREAFYRVHPWESINRLRYSPMLRADRIEQVLSSLGIKYRVSNARRIRSLRHNALVIIRWRHSPMYSHTLIWDAEKRSLLDPGNAGLSIREAEAQLYKVFYVERSS